MSKIETVKPTDYLANFRRQKDESAKKALEKYRAENKDSMKDKPKSNELGRDAFLKLMVAQLKNQNPLDPKDNQAFVAQLAQFSTVEGIEKLNKTATGFESSMNSKNALQASSLVGRSVIVNGNKNGLLMPKGVVSGFSELPGSATNMVLSIQGKNGELLEKIKLGNHDAGAMSLRWDGYNLMMDGKVVKFDHSKLNRNEILKDDKGKPIMGPDGKPMTKPYPSGQYRFKLNAQMKGKSEDVQMQMSSKVDSVTMSANGKVTLNLTGGQSATMDKVKQILDI